MIEGKISLILPAHNEEPNIGAVVSSAVEVLPRHFRDYEVVVVDDGSKDRTPEIADELAAADAHVRVVHHPRNRGYGAALTSGFDAATGDYWMFMDSDRQFDVNDIALFEPYVGRYDIVAGYRKKRSDPLHRVLYGRAFTLSVRILFGVKVRDIDCGFKLFKADVLRGMALDSPGALINTEIHAKANRQGRTLVEVGVNHYPRLEGEQSGGSLKVVTRAFKETMKLWWRMQSYVPPGGEPGTQPRGKWRMATGAIVAFVGAIGAAIAVRILRNHSKGGRRG